jgi:hypothetical protein
MWRFSLISQFTVETLESCLRFPIAGINRVLARKKSAVGNDGAFS